VFWQGAQHHACDIACVEAACSISRAQFHEPLVSSGPDDACYRVVVDVLAHDVDKPIAIESSPRLIVDRSRHSGKPIPNSPDGSVAAGNGLTVGTLQLTHPPPDRLHAAVLDDCLRLDSNPKTATQRA